MTIGLIGRKCGMTRVFTPEGNSIPVTVIEVLPNRVSQIKTQEKDGYTALQVSSGIIKKRSRVNKPEKGHFSKASIEVGHKQVEFKLADVSEFQLGNVLDLQLFEEGQRVDVMGITKGRGFAGCVKRHNFRTQDATHGNSLSHRAPGSIGQNQTPGRVFKGKRMAGHMGNTRCTIQGLKIVKIDRERNLLLVKGAIPGAPTTDVVLKRSIKHRGD